MVALFPKLMRRTGQAGLGLWAAGGIVVGASLMASHWVPLPHPNESSTLLRDSLAERHGASETWTITHFLYAQCGCSMRILDRLNERGQVEGAAQHVVMISDDIKATRAIKVAQGSHETLTPTELSRAFGIEAAPMFVVTDPQGQVLYSGGYTSRKQGPDIQDTKILAALMAGDRPESLPVYGCGVSSELKDMIDPLGIK